MNVHLVLLLSVTATTGEILYWKHNSNWNDPANWNQSRVPCSAETVVFNAPKTHNGKSLPNTFEIGITADVMLKKIVIPLGETLTLRRGVKISLSTASTCKDQGLESVTDKSVNSFIGVKPYPWNSAKNWQKSDGTSPSNPPCQNDSVVFQTKSSWIELNSHVKVGNLTWEGQSVDGLSEVPNYENYFYKSTQSADLTVEPACLQGMPQLCPCLPSSDYSFSALPTTAGVSKTLSSSAVKTEMPTASAMKSATSSQVANTPSMSQDKTTGNTFSPQPSGTVTTAAVKPTGQVLTPIVQPTQSLLGSTVTKSHTLVGLTVKPAATSAPVVTEKPGETTRKPLPTNTQGPTEAQQTDGPEPCDPEVTLCPPVVCPEGSDCPGNKDEISGSGSSTWIGVGAGVGGAVIVVLVAIIVIAKTRHNRKLCRVHSITTKE